MSGDLTRTLDDAKDWLRERAAGRRHPLGGIDSGPALRAIDTLPGTDPVSWAGHWAGIAAEFAGRAEALEKGGDPRAAREAWWQAYQFAFLGRYPVPSHPAKAEAYDRARGYFARAVALDDPPAQRVTVPFAGDRSGDGVTFWVVRPRGVTRPPVVMIWAGIDSWKEETYVTGAALRDRGFATLHVDMPGTGQSPVFASGHHGAEGAERQWDPVFAWLAGSDLDAARVGALGLSFGGYWAMKLAHTHRDQLAAAVNWGGGVHITFQPDWQARSRNASSYLMDLMTARARIFNGATFEDYVARCPGLSLLDQGILDRPCAPLLLVNGIDDLQNSAEDIWLSLRHGDPKTARLFPGGHMGTGPVAETVTDWLTTRLG